MWCHSGLKQVHPHNPERFGFLLFEEDGQAPHGEGGSRTVAGVMPYTSSLRGERKESMSFDRSFVAGLLTGVLLASGLGYYMHSASAAGSEAKTLLENERVRVRQVVFQPGVRPGVHTHQWAHVGVILDDGTLGFVEKGKKDEIVNFKSGDAGWRDANVTHEVFNAGTKPIRVVEIELKK